MTDTTYQDCGSYAAYQRHLKDDIDADDACSKAAADYRRELRAKSPELRDRERAVARARSRAMTKLAAAHRDEFLELFDQERDLETTSNGSGA